MTNLLLANILINTIAVFWLISALLLIGIILIQKGKGGGLGGAFGGAGSGGGLLGTKTGDVLTWITIGLVFMFFLLAIILVKYGKLSVPEGLEAITPETSTKIPAETGNTNEEAAETSADQTTGEENLPEGNTENTTE